MPQYVSLVNWTEKGIGQAKDTVQRSEQGRQLVERLGGKVVTFLWTQGRYDIVILFEAPDDESASAIMLAAGMLGFFRSETLRAFTAEEMQRILAKIAG